MSRVVFDSGHGMGNRKKGVWDPGAVAYGTEEAAVAWKWVLSLKFYLAKLGVDVGLTRQAFEEPCPLNSRRAASGELLVSIHCNSAASPKANGAEVWVREYAPEPTAEIAEDVCKVLASGRIGNRGIKTTTKLAVLKNSRMAMLLEIGFLSNAEDRGYITDDGYRKTICKRLADVLKEW